VKLAGRAAKFHLWLQARRQDLAAGGQKPDGGAKNRRGATFLKYSIGCTVCTNRGAKREMGVHRFQMGGPGTTGSPAGDHPVWLNIWNCRPGCFYN